MGIFYVLNRNLKVGSNMESIDTIFCEQYDLALPKHTLDLFCHMCFKLRIEKHWILKCFPNTVLCKYTYIENIKHIHIFVHVHFKGMKNELWSDIECTIVSTYSNVKKIYIQTGIICELLSKGLNLFLFNLHTLLMHSIHFRTTTILQ